MKYSSSFLFKAYTGHLKRARSIQYAPLKIKPARGLSSIPPFSTMPESFNDNETPWLCNLDMRYPAKVGTNYYLYDFSHKYAASLHLPNVRDASSAVAVVIF